MRLQFAIPNQTIGLVELVPVFLFFLSKVPILSVIIAQFLFM